MVSLFDETFAAMRINEIADKGSDNTCEGEDWIELFNDSTDTVDLKGYILHDDDYPKEVGTELTFGADMSLSGGAYLVLCCNDNDGINNPKFKVGKSDTVTLLDSSKNVVSTGFYFGKITGFGRGKCNVRVQCSRRVRANLDANSGGVERDHVETVKGFTSAK